jgi:hypothetical protein
MFRVLGILIVSVALTGCSSSMARVVDSSAVALAPIAERVQTGLLTGLNVTSFQQMPSGDPTMLWYYIASFKELNANTVEITLQLNESDTARENFKLLSSRAVTLLNGSIEGLDWIVVRSADGNITEQTMVD